MALTFAAVKYLMIESFMFAKELIGDVFPAAASRRQGLPKPASLA